MKQTVLTIVTAALVSVGVIWLEELLEPADDARPAAAAEPSAAALDLASLLNISDALVEDTWVNASRQAGSDQRTLTNAAHSICYLTKIEISGIQSAADHNACAIEVDDFTGFWQLIGSVEEGGVSEVRCNARCLSWEPSATE